MFLLGGDIRAGDTMTLRMSVVAACVLIMAGCSVKLGGQVVDILGGARPASPDAPDAVDAPPLPPPVLPPPPSIPMPSSPREVENDVRPERLAPTLEAAPATPAPAEIPGFIAADRVDLRPCPEQGTRCGPTATLRFNDEVLVLRLDQDDWAFVRVPRLGQDGYVLRTHVAPTRQTRPEGRSTTVSPPDDAQGRSRRDLPATGAQKRQGGPKEELVK
jgi:hypothetical protein